jgi:phosphoglycerol transferase MdoB-like AlkP superfamily enzyme
VVEWLCHKLLPFSLALQHTVARCLISDLIMFLIFCVNTLFFRKFINIEQMSHYVVVISS